MNSPISCPSTLVWGDFATWATAVVAAAVAIQGWRLNRTLKDIDRVRRSRTSLASARFLRMDVDRTLHSCGFMLTAVGGFLASTWGMPEVERFYKSVRFLATSETIRDLLIFADLPASTAATLSAYLERNEELCAFLHVYEMEGVDEDANMDAAILVCTEMASDLLALREIALQLSSELKQLTDELAS